MAPIVQTQSGGFFLKEILSGSELSLAVRSGSEDVCLGTTVKESLHETALRRKQMNAKDSQKIMRLAKSPFH